jgi:hypothetical protein
LWKKSYPQEYIFRYNKYIELHQAIQKLNDLLETKNPETFTSSWIFLQSQPLYKFFTKNFKTENGSVDWDAVTEKLDKRNQKKWLRYRTKKIRFYEKQEEVDKVLLKYKDKLYLFLIRSDGKEKEICNRMTVALVRLAQRGNTCARDELVNWVTYVVNDWIDKYPQIHKWKGYPDEVTDKIIGCMLRYRYTGSYLGYLFRTLEYSARGKPPIVSFDDKIGDTGKTRIDYYVEESESENPY